MRGISVGMQGIEVRNVQNQGGNASYSVGNAENWGWEWGGSGWESSYRSGNDEEKMWRGIGRKGNVCIDKNIVLTLCYNKELKKLL